MANNYTEIMKIVNQGNKMGLSNTITRDNGIPLDLSSIQENYETAVIYAATKAIAYVGQPLAVGDKLYIISDTAAETKYVAEDGTEYDNYLVEVGSKTEGDGLTIDLVDGVLMLHGISEATTVAGMLPQVEVVDGKKQIKWVTISEVVQGDGNKVTTLTSSDGSVTIEATTDTDSSLVYDLKVVHPDVPEYAVVADERAEGATSTTYHLTKDGENVDVAIVVPDAYNDEALNTRLTVVEGTVGDHETRLASVETFFKSGDEDLTEALDTLKEIQDYIDADKTVADTVTSNAAAIEVLTGTGEGSVAKTVADAVSASEATAAETYATKDELTEQVNTIDAKFNDYLKSTDAENTYVKIGDAYTKDEVDNLIGVPGEPAVGEEGEEDYIPAVPGTGVYQHVYSKDEVTALIADITGGESAADVLAALNAYKTTNDTRVKAVEDKNTTQDTAIGTAQSAAEGAQSAAEAAQGTADEAATQAATNKADISSILTRLGNIETSSGTNTDKVTVLEGKVAALEAEDIELASQIGTVAGDLSTLETNLTQENARLATLIQANTDKFANYYTKTEADAAVKAVTGEVAEDTTLVAMIGEKANQATTYTKDEVDNLLANLDQTEINEAIKANTDAIAVVVGEDTDKSMREVATEVFAGQIAEAPEAFDTLIEMANWLETHSDDAVEMDNRIKANEDKLAGIDTTVVDYVTNAIAEATYDLPAATLETLGGVKLSDEVGVNEDGQLEIKTVSTDKLVNGEEELILNGGTANGAASV